MSASSLKIEDKDLGFAKIMRDFKQMKATTITAGVHSDAEPYPQRLDRDMTDVADVAYINEFGGPPNTPERAFMRPAFDDDHQGWVDFAHTEVQNVIDKKESMNKALFNMGEKMVKSIRGKIVSLRNPPLADKTIELRQERGEYEYALDKPLMETGHMINSMTHKERTGYELDGGLPF